MFARETMHTKRAVDVVKSLLVLLVAALFVMSFTNAAFAGAMNPGSMNQGTMKSGEINSEGNYAGGGSLFSYHGKVISVDQAAKSLTVQSAPNNELLFKVAEGTSVTKCDKTVSLDKVKAGDEVTILYHQDGAGNFIAGDINLAIPPERC